MGRKRHLGIDTLGLLLTVMVTAASVSDNAGGIHLLSRIAAAHPRITKAWADTGYRATAIDHGARLGIDVHVIQRDPTVKGFKVLPDAGPSSGPCAPRGALGAFHDPAMSAQALGVPDAAAGDAGCDAS